MDKIFLIFCFFISIFFVSYPEVDIFISNLFFDKDHGFIYKEIFLAKLFFIAVPIITKLVFSIVIILLISSYFTKNYSLRKQMLFFLITGFLGQVLVVDFIFKNHFGRARPHEIQFFEGDKLFSPPMSPSNQCAKNCSFVSGHAASGFYLSAASYNVIKNTFNPYIYIISLLLGFFVGFIRIIQGDHFASDVIFSSLFINSVNLGIYILISKKRNFMK